ncbi:MAG: pilus assembly protein [Betaproteobacteria bacterium]|nr:pilus assembly protein [Betaproteobacteria bacterium]
MRKARRATAKSALVDLAARQEKYYAMNNRYADTLSLLGYSSASPNQFDVVNDGGAVYYQVKLTVTPATTSGDPAKFSATATPAGDQAKDPCGSLLLDSIGRQDVSGTAKKGCW